MIRNVFVENSGGFFWLVEYLCEGGTSSFGSVRGNGCPIFAISTRCIAKINSSAFSLPSLSTSANVLQDYKMRQKLQETFGFIVFESTMPNKNGNICLAILCFSETTAKTMRCACACIYTYTYQIDASCAWVSIVVAMALRTCWPKEKNGNILD